MSFPGQPVQQLVSQLDDLSPLYWDICFNHLYFQHPQDREIKCKYVLIVSRIWVHFLKASFFHFLRSHKDSAICSFHRPFRQELIGRNKRERGRTAFVQFFNHCENGFCICSIYLLTVKMNIAQKLQKININAKSVHAKYKSVFVNNFA